MRSCALSPRVPRSSMQQAQRGQVGHLSSILQTFLQPDALGTRGACQLRRPGAAWGAPEPSASGRPGAWAAVGRTLTTQGPGKPRDGDQTARPRCTRPALPQAPRVRPWPQAVGWGLPCGPLPTSQTPSAEGGLLRL